ncbi:MAG: response regulator transcription factor [Bdellovibrionales bacterium]|nr:response regulator transcription factor [Bdellovibrionales bacterium]
MIDDDTRLSALTKQYVGPFGIQLEAADRPSLGMARMKEETFDVLVLDLMLPEMDGFQVLKKLRETTSIPIIMLTARGDVTDRVVGLELGADDYLPKPFEPRELVARLQALHRRSLSASAAQANVENGGAKVLRAGRLELDQKQMDAKLDGKSLMLTTSEYAALELLMLRAGESLDRDQIMEALRGIEWDATNRVIDITMSRLRQKLGDDPKQPHFIKTIWGTGYAFIAAVERL